MKTSIKFDPVKGRGVYAEEKIPKGSVIEVCQLLLLDLDDVQGILEGYVYAYNKKKVALALGDGSLYNHSDHANATFHINYKNKTISIRAKSVISAGEEITINYGYSLQDKRKFRIR